MNRRPNSVCKVCNKNIYRRPNQIKSGDVFCSQICNGISQRVTKICKICSTQYIGNKNTCSRSCANQARKGSSYTGENFLNKAYRGSILKEKIAKIRGGICEECGESNYTILQIHHVHERSKGGTDIDSNLKLLCPNCHATHHLGHSLFMNKKGGRVVAQLK